MRTIVTILSCFLAISAIADQPTADAEPSGLKSIRARTLELAVPANWQPQKTTSEMRVAQFTIPSKPSAAEMVVFYFGGPTGGIKANVERWIGQFEKDGLELQMFQGQCKAGSYILVDTKGTWNKPDGPPFARKTIATPDSRALNVIVIEKQDGKQDYYFIKLSGHQDVVGKQTKVLRAAIGADAKTEKKFELKDAK